MNYILLIAISWSVNLFTWGFGPFQDAKNYIWTRFSKHPWWFQYLFELISCPKCCGFWTGYILTQDIIQSLLISLLSGIMEKLLRDQI